MTGDWYNTVWTTHTATINGRCYTNRTVSIVKRTTPHPCAYGKRTPLAGCACGCNA